MGTVARFHFIKKPLPFGWAFDYTGDLAGARTQDPLLKREMLYQLSYQVNKTLGKFLP